MHLILVLSNGCNRNCRYCYVDTRRRAPMTLATGRRAVEFALQTSPTSLQVGFFGGEPLLRFELLRQLSDYVIARTNDTSMPAFQLATNGDSLTPESSEYFKSQDFDVALSAHDDDLVTTERSLAMLRAAGIEPRVVLVADPLSAAHLTSRVTALLRNGVRKIGISPDYYATWDANARSELAASYHGLAALYRRHIADRDALRIGLFDVRLRALRDDVPLRNRHCKLGRETIVVAPDGTIFPCDRMAVDACGASAAIGNVFTGADHAKWDQIVAQRHRIPQRCRSCRHLPVCAHFCACVNMRLTGRFCATPETVCWHESMLGDIVFALRAELDEAQPPLVPRRCRNLVRVTAGCVIATGAFSLSCRDAPTPQGDRTQTAPKAVAQSQPVQEVWVTYPACERALDFIDKDGKHGSVSLELLTALPAERTEQILGEHEAEVLQVIRRSFAQIETESLAERVKEDAFGNQLLKQINLALAPDSGLRGIRLRVCRSGIDPKMLEELQQLLGYIDD